MIAMRLRSVIVPALGYEIGPTEIVQDLACGVGARRRHDAAARMSARAAHVEALHGAAILRVTWEWTVEEELIHRQLALEDVAFGEAHFVLELARRAALDVAHQ